MDFTNKLIERLILLTIIIVPSIFVRSFEDIFDLPKVTIIKFITVIIIFLLIPKIIKGKKLTFYKSGIDLSVILFCSCAVLSTIFSIHKQSSIVGNYKFYFWGLWTLLCFFIFYFITEYLTSEIFYEKVIDAILLSSIPVLFYGVIQKLKMDPFSWSSDPYGRVFSSLGNANFLGAYISMILPFSFVKILISGTKIKKLIWILWYIISFSIMVLSLTRSSWMGFLISSGIFIYFLRNELFGIIHRKKNIFIFISLSMVLMFYLLLVNPSVFNRAKIFVSFSESGAQARFSIWKTAGEIFLKRPIIGYGLDTFSFVFLKYQKPDFIKYQGRSMFATNAHNEILELAVSIGVLGLAAYFFIWFNIFRMLIKSSTEFSNDKKIVFVSVATSLIAIFVHSQFNFSVVTTSFLFWILLGILVKMKNEKNKYVNKIFFNLSKSVKLVLLSCSVFFILTLYPAVRICYADYIYKKGQIKDSYLQYDKALFYYEEAYRLNPYIDTGNITISIGNIYKKLALSTKNKEVQKNLLLWANYYFNKNIKYFPLSAYDHNNLAMSYFWLARYLGENTIEKIFYHLKIAMTLAPNSVQILNNYATINLYVGDITEAKKTWTKSLKLDPTFSEAKDLINLTMEDPKLLK